MIQLFQVSKIYPSSTVALKNINLQIERGECVFVIGPSGAGKTTLLKLLFRGEEPSEGEVVIAGKNVTQLNRRGVARLRQRIGLVFQDIKFLVDMTVLDNVALAALVAGAPRRASYRKAQGLLGEFGLAEKVHAGPLALSRGEQQRVAIARALMNDPFLLLADEPTGNLDAEHAEKTMEIFLKIRQGGTTLMIASHNLALGQRYGTRIISLQHGCLIDDWERVSR
ncbi:MAG TPA: ATP-binding cassette domain-containing protein [Candidatus Binatia bacterium]|nr:ATP-binding cassette domain-containing protein [Candidatus Binatia bacterium]